MSEYDDDLNSPERLVEHLKECRQVDAAIVQDGNADELVARLISEGWTYGGVGYIEGKRMRYLVPPPGVLLKGEEPPSTIGATAGGVTHAHTPGQVTCWISGCVGSGYGRTEDPTP